MFLEVLDYQKNYFFLRSSLSFCFILSSRLSFSISSLYLFLIVTSVIPAISATSNWTSINSLKNAYGRDPDEATQILIKSLRSKDFEQGLQILINEAVKEKGLIGGDAEMSNDKIFTLDVKNLLDNAQLKYFDEENTWKWTLIRSDAWEHLTGTRSVLTLVDLNSAEKAFLASLEGKDFFDGAIDLFWIDFEVKEGEEKYFGLSSTQEISTEELTANEELIQKFEEQTDSLGWENWDDVEHSISQFSNKEKNVILNAEDCDECGKGVVNGCDIKECIAIGFRMRDELGLGKACAYIQNKCKEVVFGESSQEIFVIFGKTTLFKQATNLYYKYENEWQWTPYSDKTIWMSTTTTTVTNGEYQGKSPSDINIDIIKSLNGKNYEEGKKILKDNGGLMEDRSEIVLSATSEGFEGIPAGGTCEPPEELESVKPLTNPQLKVQQAAKDLNGTIVNKPDCFYGAHAVYDSAGVGMSTCVYSDSMGRTYEVEDNTLTIGVDKNTKGEIIFKVTSNPQVTCSFNNRQENFVEYDKLKGIDKGYMLSYVYRADPKSPHNAIFIRWLNKNTGYAELFDWNGPYLDEGEIDRAGKVCTKEDFYSNKNYCKTFRYYEEYLTDDEHPVYMMWEPKLKSS